LYVVVKSTNPSDSNTYKTLEKWDFNAMFDSAKTLTGIVAPGTNNLNVGTRFRGQTVGSISNGVVLPNRVVAYDGTVSFTQAELGSAFQAYSVQVGLNFTCSFKSMPLNTNPGTRGGQNAMKEKKITRMNLRVLNSAGVYVDGNLATVFNGTVVSNQEVQTGIIQDNNGGNGWGTEVVPLITVPGATPFHLQAIEYEVESS
jgi:hypothetical protein